MRARIGIIAVIWSSLAIGRAAVAQPGSLVYNGGFEAPAGPDPPPGWAMWGAQEFKDPRNFARDTQSPHGGAACLRILHPANTGGYLVTDPAHAIHPRDVKRYEISFWARSDRAGESLFGFTCYTSVSPFVDAPSPGFHRIPVGTDWRRYAFSIAEGRDFFADQCRYLLLTFDAAADRAEQRTLWIDDVTATESPSSDKVRLLNMATIPHASLKHRLRPGSSLDFTVDVTRRIGRATGMTGGVSFHRVVGWTGQPYDRSGRYTLDPRLEAAIREMKLPMTRFYGVADEPFGLEGALDRIVSLCRRIGVAQENVVLELEPQDANRDFPPEIWARAVRYCRAKGYRFRYWEVANEPYSSTFHASSPMGRAFPTPESYVEHVRQVAAAIRRVNASAQVGIGINPESLTWGNLALKTAAGSYDFVVPHLYAGMNAYRTPFETLVLTQNWRMLELALRLSALIRAYNPGRNVRILDTEWGMIGGGPHDEEADYAPRNANGIGLVHRAVRMIYYAREGIVAGASSWQMLSNLDGPGFGILSQQAPDKRFLLYWLSYYFSRHVGEWALATDGSAPYQPESANSGPITPVLATLSSDGKSLDLVIANGSWDRDVPLRARIRGFRVARANGKVFTQPSLDSPPLLPNAADPASDLQIAVKDGEISGTIPAHSVVFIRLFADG